MSRGRRQRRRLPRRLLRPPRDRQVDCTPEDLSDDSPAVRDARARARQHGVALLRITSSKATEESVRTAAAQLISTVPDGQRTVLLGSSTYRERGAPTFTLELLVIEEPM